MKIAEANIVMVPGFKNSPPDHWQSRWEAKMPTARRVQQSDWHKPVMEEWVGNFTTAIEATDAPIVIVAHSLGGQTAILGLVKLDSEQRSKIRGAFIVAPPDVENPAIRPRHLMTFGPYSREPLPFPSVVIASQTDPFCSFEVAGDMANAWGSLLIDARDSGHIDVASGHGPWPDGLMVFANFMKRLEA
ncbi:MAG: alpha/beta hydrolase [Ahrensia sp.]|nr:alpha/beta hydrolase [Ahrensia sp.]